MIQLQFRTSLLQLWYKISWPKKNLTEKSWKKWPEKTLKKMTWKKKPPPKKKRKNVLFFLIFPENFFTYTNFQCKQTIFSLNSLIMHNQAIIIISAIGPKFSILFYLPYFHHHMELQVLFTEFLNLDPLSRYRVSKLPWFWPF